MALRPEQIADLDNLTQDAFEKGDYTDVSLKKQRYVLEDALGGKGDRKVSRAGGKRLTWKVKDRNLNSFRQSGLYGVETAENADLSRSASLPWTKQIVGYSYDIDEEAFQGDDATEIVDLLEMRVQSMWCDWFDGMEELMWLAPTSSTQDPLPPAGIPFWIQQANATSTFGFNGGNPSGFTDGAAGLSSTTVDQWKNGNATYVTVDDDDFLLKLSEACDKCYFKPPRAFNQLGKGDPIWGFYTVYSVIQKLRALAKAQNDNIGRDIGMYSEEVIYRRLPIEWVPALDAASSAALDTADPLYGINWRTLHYVFQKGKDMVKSPPITPTDQPSVRRKFMWRWGNFRCYDRRANFVLKKA